MSIRPASPVEFELLRMAGDHTPACLPDGSMPTHCPRCSAPYPCPALLWALAARQRLIARHAAAKEDE